MLKSSGSVDMRLLIKYTPIQSLLHWKGVPTVVAYFIMTPSLPPHTEHNRPLSKGQHPQINAGRVPTDQIIPTTCHNICLQGHPVYRSRIKFCSELPKLLRGTTVQVQVRRYLLSRGHSNWCICKHLIHPKESNYSSCLTHSDPLLAD